ncbi:MAG: PH domain-containing protein [Renibacterium sp.]|nr:PH domain-containing protein [Renibacterium sp.]
MRNWLVPGEQVIVLSRPQAKRLAWPAVVMILLPTVLGVASAWLSRARWAPGWEPWRPTVSLLAGLVVLVILLFYPVRKYLQWLATKYILTSRRLVLRSGILVRRHQDIPLFSVRTLSVRQGVLQRIFRSGNITLVSGIDDAVRVRDVPEVLKFKNLALEAIAELPHSALLGDDARAPDPAAGQYPGEPRPADRYRIDPFAGDAGRTRDAEGGERFGTEPYGR